MTGTQAGAHRLAVFGTGRAGTALLRSLVAAGVDVEAVGSRSAPGLVPEGALARRGLAALAQAAVEQDATLLVLAVPDRALPAVDEELAALPALPPAVVHLSGASGAEALAATSTRALVGSFHPLAALDPVRPIPRGTVLGVHASSTALEAELKSLARTLGLVPVDVQAGSHARYHLGAAVAANLPLALLAEASRLLASAGVEEEAALTAAVRLMRSALDNVEAGAKTRADLGAVLTGPVARGDQSTIDRHLEQTADDERLDSVYRALTSVLVELKS